MYKAEDDQAIGRPRHPVMLIGLLRLVRRWDHRIRQRRIDDRPRAGLHEFLQLFLGMDDDPERIVHSELSQRIMFTQILDREVPVPKSLGVLTPWLTVISGHFTYIPLAVVPQVAIHTGEEVL
jgi:hypothetical protein